MQQSLLPPHLQPIPGVQLAVRYRRGVGGPAEVFRDFYDVFPSVSEAWAVVVGDVSDKGPQPPCARTRTGWGVRVSCAGYDPALVRHADAQVETLGPRGLILGWLAQPALHEQRTVLLPGDSLLLCTDGLAEGSRADTRDMFGLDRLYQVLSGVSAASAE